MSNDLSVKPFPLSAAFKVIMAAQPHDAARLEAAIKIAETSTDPDTKAAGIFYVQRHFLRIADPDIDLSTIETIAAANKQLERYAATNAAACDRLRKYVLKG